MKTETVIPFSVQRMICTGCGAEANASCTCGVAYVPAAKRVAEYDKANPGKSTRQAAADLGVSQPTVVEARKSGDRSLSPDTVTGRDGKQYPAKRTAAAIIAGHKPDPDPTIDNDENDEDYDIESEVTPRNLMNAFLIRADQARRFAVYSGKVTKEVKEAAAEAADAWNQLVQQMEQS